MKDFSQVLPILQGRILEEVETARLEGLIRAQPGHPDPIPVLKAELGSLLQASWDLVANGPYTGPDPVLALQKQIDAVFERHQANGDFPQAPGGGLSDAVKGLQGRIDALLVAEQQPTGAPAAEAAAGGPTLDALLTGLEQRLIEQLHSADEMGNLEPQPGRGDPVPVLERAFEQIFDAARARGDTSEAGADPIDEVQKEVSALIDAMRRSGDLPPAPSAGSGDHDFVAELQARIDRILDAVETPGSAQAPPAATAFDQALDQMEQRITGAIGDLDAMGVVQADRAGGLLRLQTEVTELFEAAKAKGPGDGTTDPLTEIEKSIDDLIRMHQETGELPLSPPSGGGPDYIKDLQADIGAILKDEDPPDAGGPPDAGAGTGTGSPAPAQGDLGVVFKFLVPEKADAADAANAADAQPAGDGQPKHGLGEFFSEAGNGGEPGLGFQLKPDNDAGAPSEPIGEAADPEAWGLDAPDAADDGPEVPLDPGYAVENAADAAEPPALADLEHGQ